MNIMVITAKNKSMMNTVTGRGTLLCLMVSIMVILFIRGISTVSFSLIPGGIGGVGGSCMVGTFNSSSSVSLVVFNTVNSFIPIIIFKSSLFAYSLLLQLKNKFFPVVMRG